MTPTYLEAIPLNYRKYGDTGPDLIVLHGLFGSGKNWRSFARSIVNDFQIWMPDARNHGESPHAETMSYKEMAEDVVCFLDNNGLERIMLLGQSMGGKTAMQVALGSRKEFPALLWLILHQFNMNTYKKILNSSGLCRNLVCLK